MQCRGIRAHLVARGKFHGFSRVAAGTWCTFSSFGGDYPSKIMFVQRRQDSCLVTRDTTGISMRLGRAIQMLLDLRQETSQPSSPFEALNSAWLSSFQRDVRPPVQMRQGPRAFLGSPQGIKTSLHLVRLKTSLHSSHYRKSLLLLSQGILISIPLEAAISGFLSHTFCLGKPPLEIHVESWHTSSVKVRESPLISRRFGVHKAFLELLC